MTDNQEQPEILIVPIDLTIDLEEEIRKEAMSLNEETQQAITELVNSAEKAQQEKQLRKTNKDQDKKLWEDRTNKSIKLLEGSDKPIPAKQLLKECGTDQLSRLVQRINNHLKKHKPQLKLTKTKKSGDVLYSLEPHEPE